MKRERHLTPATGRRRFVVAALAAAVAAAGRSLAGPVVGALAAAPHPCLVPLGALDLRAPHDLAG